MAEILPIRRKTPINQLIRQSYDISYLVAPGPVSDITVLTTTSRSLMLSWTQPCHPKGIITNYRIKIQTYNDSIDNQGRYTNNNNTLNTTDKSTSFNVTNLLPYRFYVFTVNTEVQDVGNLSEPTVSEPFQTDTEGICFFFIQFVVILAIVFTCIFLQYVLYMFLQHHIHPEILHSVASHQVLCKYGGNIRTFKLVPPVTRLLRQTKMTRQLQKAVALQVWSFCTWVL